MLPMKCESCSCSACPLRTISGVTSRQFLVIVDTGVAAAAVLLVLADTLDTPVLAAVGAVILLAVVIVRTVFVHTRDEL